MLTTTVLQRTQVVNASCGQNVDHGTQTRQYVLVNTLKERLAWVRDNRFDGNASRWSEQAGLNRIHVGKLLKREGTDSGHVELDVIMRLADAGGVSRAWLAFGNGGPNDDPPIATLLMQLQLLPGLAETIRKFPDRWRTSTLARAATAVFQSDSNGIPLGGWEAALDTLQSQGSGEFSLNITTADVSAATAKQVGKRPKLLKQ
jgi:hypothetical protein